MTWFDIKRAAIKMNRDRAVDGTTVDEMLGRVRSLIAQNGYEFSGPTPDLSGGYDFRSKDGNTLTYDGASNTWKP